MTKPAIYYSDEYVTLYHGDALTNHEWLNANVLITDPPYGVNFVSQWRENKNERHAAIHGDQSTEVRDKALELWGNKPALVFGTWRAPKPENVRQRLIWAKGDDPGMGDLTLPWGYGDEEIYAIGHGWTGARRTNVYRIPKISASNNPGHPTPKPIPLLEALIEHTPEEWTIADPFTGTGATLIAARNLGRKAIGIEIEERYCEITATRLQNTPLPITANLTPKTKPATLEV